MPLARHGRACCMTIARAAITRLDGTAGVGQALLSTLVPRGELSVTAAVA